MNALTTLERLEKLTGRGWRLRAIRIQHAESLMYCGAVDGKTWARRMGGDLGGALREFAPAADPSAYAGAPAPALEGALELLRALLAMPHVRGHLQLSIEIGRPCQHHRREEFAMYAGRCHRWQLKQVTTEWLETRHPIEDPATRAAGLERLAEMKRLR